MPHIHTVILLAFKQSVVVCLWLQSMSHKAVHPDHYQSYRGPWPSICFFISVAFELFQQFVKEVTQIMSHFPFICKEKQYLHKNHFDFICIIFLLLQLHPPSAVSHLQCRLQPPITALLSVHPRGVPLVQELSWFPQWATVCQTLHL